MLRVGASVLMATLAAAGATAAVAPPVVRLVAPADGATLVAGATAWLDWEPLGDLDPAIEEWEAFLSVDGGRYYAVRLTPHLDLDRWRFAFEVPDLPTADARLLLRFGDERTEVGVELPARLRIVRERSAPAAASALPVLAAGEAARPGDPGVLAWVAGGRDGRGLSHRRAADPPGAAPAQLWAMGAALVGVAPVDLRPAAPSASAVARAPQTAAARPRGAVVVPRASADPLLLTGRRNE